MWRFSPTASPQPTSSPTAPLSYKSFESQVYFQRCLRLSRRVALKDEDLSDHDYDRYNSIVRNYG